jgi:hypothetical protein
VGPGDMSNRDDGGPRDQDPGSGSRRGAVIGLILVLALVVVAYFLVNALRKESNLEDCLMSGRTNCAPLDVPAKR